MPFKFSPRTLRMPATQQIDGDVWLVERPFLYIRPSGEKIFVPPSGLGSLDEILKRPVWSTDYGSIPTVFQNVFKRDGDYGPAYVLHDWLYQSEMFDRATCDWILLEALQELGAWWLTRNTIYSAVRSAGWSVWSGHNRKLVKACKAYQLIFQARLISHDSPWPDLAQEAMA